MRMIHVLPVALLSAFAWSPVAWARMEWKETRGTTIKAAHFSSRATGLAAENEGWLLNTNGRVACRLEFPTNGTYTFVLTAKGQKGGGDWPMFKAGIDGREAVAKKVNSAAWMPYVFSHSVSGGLREIYIEYANDFDGHGEDRNLYLAHLTIVSPPPAGPVLAVGAPPKKPGAGPATPPEAKPVPVTPSALLRDATPRIHQVRKGTLAVAVIDALGSPVAGATVTVQQVRHEFLFGEQLCPAAFDDSLPSARRELYRRSVSQLFNSAGSGDALNWIHVEPERGQRAFAVFDAMAGWCASNAIALHAAGVWAECEAGLPAWVRALRGTELRQTVQRHARDVTDRYKDQVNETILDLNEAGCRFLDDRLGSASLLHMIREARKLNPSLQIIARCPNALDAAVLAQSLARLKALRDEGVPVSGIGLGLSAVSRKSLEALGPALDAAAATKLPVRVEGMDLSAADEEQQARLLDAALVTAYSHPAVEAIFLDEFWAHCAEDPSSALVEEDFKLRPAGRLYAQRVLKDWWTHEEGVSDADGLFSCEAFYGEHRVIVPDAEGRVRAAAVSLHRARGTASIVVQLGGPEDEAERPVGK